MSPPVLIVAAAGSAALAVSPILARLVDYSGHDISSPPTQPRNSRHTTLVVAGSSLALALLASAGHPVAAWWLLATGGAALSIIDLRHHLLPRRIVYPLGAVIAATLIAAAIAVGHYDHLLRAAAAGAVVGGAWLLVKILAPSSVGLGDVRLAALTATLAGWTSWTTVLGGQLSAMLLGIATVILSPLLTRTRWTRTVAVPMGPALITGALIACWF